MVGIWCLRCANGYSGSVALGAREIENDLRLLVWRIEFALDGRESAKKQVAGVSHDGASAGSDSVGGEEFVEFAENMIDVHCGMELLYAADERIGEIAGVDLLKSGRRMTEAQAGFGIGDGHAAAASAGSASRAVRQGECRFFENDGFLIHETSFRCERGVPIREAKGYTPAVL